MIRLNLAERIRICQSHIFKICLPNESVDLNTENQNGLWRLGYRSEDGSAPFHWQQSGLVDSPCRIY